MSRLTSHQHLFNKTKKCQKHQFNMIQPQENFFMNLILLPNPRPSRLDALTAKSHLQNSKNSPKGEPEVRPHIS